MPTILAGDIGGTKSNLGLFEVQGARLVSVVERSYPSQRYATLEMLVKEFLRGRSESIDEATFGIACPIVNGVCNGTNLPWSVSVYDLRQKLHIQRLTLINDLEAMALGIASLPEESFAVVNAGKEEPRGCRAVVAAGTGLGEAGLVWEAGRYRVLASEGGHADFGPRDDREMALLRFLLKKFGRVSYERVLSGPGLFNVYQFLREDRKRSDPPWLAEAMSGKDPSVVITDAALVGRDPLCVEALEMFISLYGAEAGNMALKLFTTGGIFIGGGIAPKILHKLKEGSFMKSFAEKGRLSSFLSSVPVKVILDTRGPLLGAASYGISRDNSARNVSAVAEP